MKKIIAITGGSISGNKGAEAMTTTVIRSLRKEFPDAEFILFTPYKKADIALLDKYEAVTLADSSPVALVIKHLPLTLLERLFNLPFSSLSSDTKLLKKADILIDVAGISFSDGREIYLPFNVLTIWPKLLLRGKVAKVSQALGPFKNRINRTLAKWLIPRCCYLAARGSGTVENLKSIGLSGFDYCPDITFAMNNTAEMNVLNEKLVAYLNFGDTSKKIVGLCPSSVVYKACQKRNIDYVKINAEFTNYLIQKNYRVLFIPHSIRPATTKLKNNDLPVINKIIALTGSNKNISVVKDELNSIQLRKLIGQCNLFIGSRFHSMISSLSMAVPTAVCGWGHKYFEILDLFGLRDYAIDYHQLSLDGMTKIFENLQANSNNIHEKINLALPNVNADANIQIDALIKLLKNNSTINGADRKW
ncbi:MAG TPA: polysaccharide pyruvyl transferase family protein [Sedimentisphaerales bacterium]|nr:polysaccharide pyruvyl transferase family protein [Sedimentisphaerales bacterium]